MHSGHSLTDREDSMVAASLWEMYDDWAMSTG